MLFAIGHFDGDAHVVEIFVLQVKVSVKEEQMMMRSKRKGKQTVSLGASGFFLKKPKSPPPLDCL